MFSNGCWCCFGVCGFGGVVVWVTWNVASFSWQARNQALKRATGKNEVACCCCVVHYFGFLLLPSCMLLPLCGWCFLLMPWDAQHHARDIEDEDKDEDKDEANKVKFFIKSPFVSFLLNPHPHYANHQSTWCRFVGKELSSSYQQSKRLSILW